MLTAEEAGGSKKYENYIEALRVAKTEVNDGSFALDMEKGEFDYVEKIIHFDNYAWLLDVGCVANPPSIKFSCKNYGNNLSYIRILNQTINRDGFFKKGIANIGNISKALNNIGDCSETLSAGRRNASITIFKEYLKDWSYNVRGCDICKEAVEKRSSIEGAIEVLIDFYQPKNL
ncbi:hypothetical protein D4Q76_01165 [archaeon]|nr:MAG: hypothetical protein D4Q76_01165 [archaeon]